MKKLVLISAPVFVLHIIEEVITDFHSTDGSVEFLGAVLSVDPTTAFIIVQVILAVIILLAYATEYRLFRAALGVAFIVELSHIVPALINWEYTSGLFTSILLSGLGVIYWKRFMKGKSMPE